MQMRSTDPASALGITPERRCRIRVVVAVAGGEVVGEDFDPDDLSGRAVQDLRGADLRQDGLAGNGGANARHSGAVTGAA